MTTNWIMAYQDYCFGVSSCRLSLEFDLPFTRLIGDLSGLEAWAISNWETGLKSTPN